MATLSKDVLARYAKELQDTETSVSSLRIPFLKLPNGKTRVRILPGQEPGSLDRDWYVKATSHYNVNPNNPKIPVICPQSTVPNAFCPIHDKVRKLKNSADPADQAEAKRMWPKTYYYMSILLLDGPEAGSVKVLQGRTTLWKKIMSIMQDSQYGDVTDPREGFDLTFVKLGKDLETEYDVIPSRMPTPISESEEEIADYLDNLYDLSKFRMAPSNEEIVAFMNGEITRFTTGGFGKQIDVNEEDSAMAEAGAKAFVEATKEEEEPVPEPAPVNVKPTVEAPKRRFAAANLDSIKKKLNS